MKQRDGSPEELAQSGSWERRHQEGNWQSSWAGFREWERPRVLHFFKESKPLLLEMKTLMCSLSEHLEMFLFDSAEIWGAQCVRTGFV